MSSGFAPASWNLAKTTDCSSRAVRTRTIQKIARRTREVYGSASPNLALIRPAHGVVRFVITRTNSSAEKSTAGRTWMIFDSPPCCEYTCETIPIGIPGG